MSWLRKLPGGKIPCSEKRDSYRRSGGEITSETFSRHLRNEYASWRQRGRPAFLTENREKIPNKNKFWKCALNPLRGLLIDLFFLKIIAPVHPRRDGPEADHGDLGWVQGRDRGGGDHRHPRGHGRECLQHSFNGAGKCCNIVCLHVFIIVSPHSLSHTNLKVVRGCYSERQKGQSTPRWVLSLWKSRRVNRSVLSRDTFLEVHAYPHA